MKFHSNKCIQEIKCPNGCGILAYDYSCELNLIASFGSILQIVFIWDPDTREIVKEIDLMMDFYNDVIFLAGPYIAVTCHDPLWTGFCVYSIDSGRRIIKVVEDECPKNDYDGCNKINLSPKNEIIFSGCMIEYFLDLNTKKVVNKRHLHDWCSVLTMCCSKFSYTICIAGDDPEEGFQCLNVEFSSNGKASSTVEHVTHCMIGGKKRVFEGKVTGLAHDGENIIVATQDDIIVLESANEGSIGHVIVSSGFSSHCDGQIRVNHKNQLMVSNCSNVIEVYEYKQYDTLQACCRHVINSILKQNKEKINKLPLPNLVKNYLLYQM